MAALGDQSSVMRRAPGGGQKRYSDQNQKHSSNVSYQMEKAIMHFYFTVLFYCNDDWGEKDGWVTLTFFLVFTPTFASLKDTRVCGLK